MNDTHRARRRSPLIEGLVLDVRYGARTLLKHPGFTLAALVTLALGIGANTAVFSIVNAVLLRPLPYPEPDRIVQLMRRHSAGTETGQTGRRYLFFREHMRATVESMTAWRWPSGVNLVTGESAEFVRAMSVSREFFDVFGVQPLVGRTFAPEHDVSGGPDVALLTEQVWRRLFGGDPAVLGRPILLGGRPHTVIGVTPGSFSAGAPTDLFIPLRPGVTGPGGGFNYQVAARLKPDATPEQAAAEASSVWKGMQRDYPTQMLKNELSSTVQPLAEIRTRGTRPGLLMMFGAVGMLLFIACANLANLLLARAAGRGREIALRAALGAQRARIIRQLLTESVLLALVGATLGALLAYWTVPALLAITPSAYRVDQEVRIDSTVLAVTFGLALGTGLLFGLGPALGLSRQDLVDAFKDDGNRTAGSRRAGWVRSALVVAEIAVCLVLLVGAGLLIRTFVNMRSVDPGFDPQGVLTAQMSLQGERFADGDKAIQFLEQGLERIRHIPGVDSAAVVNGLPIEQGLNLNVDVLDGPERVERAVTDWRYTSAGYFRTMGMSLAAGRDFDERDRRGAAPVAVVNEEFARRFFKGTNALGRHIRVFQDDGQIEIVGIVRNVREQGLTGPIPPVIYVPVLQANPRGIASAHFYFPMSWVVRARSNATDLGRALTDEMRALDPQQPFSSIRTMDDIKMAYVATQRFQMSVLSAFAGIGLLLAAAGVYGLIAYSVAQRTREIGIRMALGATPGRILLSVLWQGGALALLGVACGVAAAAALTRTLQSFVWNVSTLDPLTFALVGVTLVFVAILASLLPAWRALALNPLSALRE